MDKIYVTNSGSDSVSLIDDYHNKLQADNITGLKNPSRIAVEVLLKGNVYVLNSPSFPLNLNLNGNVSTISGFTDKKTSNNTLVGKNPYDIEISPKDKIYVANHGERTVSVINGKNNSKIAVGEGPYYIAINSNTNKIYVTNQYDGTVSVINGTTDKKEADIRVGKGPTYMTINKEANKIYVTNSGSNSISVIDGYSNHKIKDIPVGNDPTVLAINPNTNIIYVVECSNSDGVLSSEQMKEFHSLLSTLYPFAKNMFLKR
jgi:YVTN family beta-propeller protein